VVEQLERCGGRTDGDFAAQVHGPGEVTGFSVIERCALSSAQSGGFARPIEDPAGRADAFCRDG
jgi:hypothetical protein